MQGLWSGLGVASYALMTLSGGVNAWYFARRVAQERGTRRLAAGVLVAVFAGIAIEGAAQLAPLAGGASLEAAPLGMAETLRRAPLLTASLITSALLVLGAQR